jgi:hypothetical protein
MSKQINTSNNNTETTTTAAANAAATEIHAKYKGILHNTSQSARENGAFITSAEQNLDALDAFLEDEKQHNKTKTWNKLDKTMRAQKLHAYAEKYIHEHGLPIKSAKVLKSFFSKCLDEQKLQKTKEVIYDKDTREVLSVVGLAFHPETHEFFIRITDAKHVSTIKSLTPKRNV